MSYEEKQKKLIKNESTQQNKIIKKIEKYYDIPKQKKLYKPTLEYLKENPNHHLNRQDMQIDIVQSKFSPEILNIITAKKGIIVYSRIDFAVHYLFHTNYITKKGKEYFITDKGLKNMDNPNLANIVEKEFKEYGEKNNIKMNRFNIYSNIILKILSNNLTYQKDMIIDNIITLLLPNNQNNKTIELFSEETEKVINKMLQDELISEDSYSYKITQKGSDLINNKISEENIQKEPEENLDEKLIIKPKVNKPADISKTKNDLFTVFNKTYEKINKTLPEKLLKKVKNCDPFFFEKLSLNLLKKIYRINESGDSGNVTNKTKDGGIDGYIYKDYFKTEKILFQSKRYNEKTVDVQTIRSFGGILSKQPKDTGVVITTSRFTRDAIEEAKELSIALIDGEKLVELMIEYNVGIKTQEYNIDMIDEEYFKKGE